MKQITLLFILLFGVFQITFSQEKNDFTENKTYILSGIRVETADSADYIDKNAVIAYSGLNIGEEISIPGVDISNAIKKLWKQNIFSDISIEAENVVSNKIFLVIKLKERSRIAKFKFVGINKGAEDELRAQIKWVIGSIYNENKKESAIRIVKNYYREKGFLNCEVEVTSEPSKILPNSLAIAIKIKKEKRVKIQNIHFAGVTQIKESKLKKVMHKTKEKRFYRIFSRSKFLKPAFKTDLNRVIAFYNTKGFIDAKVEADTIYSVNPKNINVEIKIYEGKKYYIRNIYWTGNYKYDSNFLSEKLNIDKGDIYDKSKLERKLFADPEGGDITSLYMDDGYLFFRVEPVEIKVLGDSIDIEMRMREGPQATINKVSIEGNQKTSDFVIRRELRTLPGEKFSRSDLIRSQREILNLGYFDQEKLNVIPIPNQADGTVDLKYIVEEKSSDQLQFQIGYGGKITDAQGNTIGGGLIGTIQVVLNNFSAKRFFDKHSWNPLPSGDGQKVSFAIQMNGTGYQNYAVSFVEPWFGGKKPNSLGLSFNYSIQNPPTGSYRIDIFGASMEFGTRLKFPDDFFQSFTSLGYKYYNLRNAFTTFGVSNGFINIISLTQTIQRSSINAPIYPRSGSMFSFSSELTPPYSLFMKKDYKQLEADENYGELYNLLEFHKWKFKASLFTSIAGNLVLNTRMQFGYLGKYNRDLSDIPFERFYLGGDGLAGWNLDGREIIALRGYDANSIGPVSYYGVSGGTVYDKITVELRYPISLKSIPIWVQAFFDAGNAFDGLKNFNPYDVKKSAGLGIRLFMPMLGGLIGVDWAYRFDNTIINQSKSAPTRIHFMLGQQF